MEERRSQLPFRKTFQLLCWEGAFAAAYDVWVSPTYLTGLAGELGIGIALVSEMCRISVLLLSFHVLEEKRQTRSIFSWAGLKLVLCSKN